jgi:riboflavin kinase/FMN adenylyltransferase
VKVSRGTQQWRERGCALTLGNFDGVHRGHRALLEVTCELAREHAVPCAVLTFDPAPRDVLRPHNAIPRIQSLERKLVHLERAGVDGVIVQPFDLELAALPAQQFAERLRDHLGVRAIAVGHDFRFGHKRSGGVDTLREVLGIPVREVAALRDEEGPISSSRIREALGRGEVARAAQLLGRPHELVGQVTPGDRRGRTIGFPTANLWPQGGLVPPNGVYAVRVRGPLGARDGVANLGTRPTFTGEGQTDPQSRLEIHLLDFEGDLYGQELIVELIDRLREEQRFPSVDALVAQIRLDVERARQVLKQS